MRQDIQLLDNDLVIQNGDFVVDASDEQHIQDTINAFPGWWKQNPLDGVGIGSWRYSPANVQAMTKAIKLNLQADGYICSPTITLDASGKMIIVTNAEF